MAIMRLILIAILTCIPFTANATCGATSAEIDFLKKFITGKPKNMANEAIKHGNTKFLGVRGYSVIVPGIENKNCHISQGKLIIIQGTTDVFCSSEHMKLIHTASVFAEQYNNIIKEHIISNGGSICD